MRQVQWGADDLSVGVWSAQSGRLWRWDPGGLGWPPVGCLAGGVGVHGRAG
jgi:hypothetical protein